MNYGDAQQQQYYGQRIPMPQQTQTRMQGLPPQQQQQMHPAGMVAQQSRMPMMYQPQPMVRMGNQHMVQQQQGISQQQQQIRAFMQTLPAHVQQQISAEGDPERRRHMIQTLFQRHHQQQQLYEQQQQQMAMMQPVGTAGTMRQMNVPTPRMSMVQATSGGGQVPVVFTTSHQQFQPQHSQPSIVQQQQPGPANIQRIPSQGSFVHSPASSQAGAGAAVHQLRPAQQMGVGATQNQPGMQLRAPMSVNPSQFVQHQQSIHKPFENAGAVPSSQNDNIRADPQLMGTGMVQNRTAGPLSTGQLMSTARIETPSLRSAELQSADQQQQHSVGESNSATAAAAAGTQPQQVVDTEEPEYKALLQKLCKYHGDVKRLLGRLEIDTPAGMEPSRSIKSITGSLVNVIQVMEGTRKGGPVSKTLLQKLLANVQTVLERYHISRNLFNTAKKLATLSQTRRTVCKEQIVLDPWRSVRHLKIRTPDSILEMEKNDEIREKEEKETNGRKRGRNEREEEEEHADEPPAKKSLLTNLAESFSLSQHDKLEEKRPIEEQKEQEEKDQSREGEFRGQFRIGCLDGSELVLGSRLAEALRGAIGKGFKVQLEGPDMEPPISGNTPAVQIRFQKGQTMEKDEAGSEKPGMATGELDVLVPVNYPQSPMELLPKSNVGTDTEHLMERIDAGFVDMYSLEDLLSEWTKQNE